MGVVCIGGKSVLINRLAAKTFARKIQKVVMEVKFSDFKIQNIVASYATGYPIDINMFYVANRVRCKFEQENFPGLKLHLSSQAASLNYNGNYNSSKSTISKQTAIIFYSGKFILTGFKSEQDIFDQKDYIKRLLLRFKK